GVAIQWVIAGEDGELIHHVVYVEDEGYDWRARVDFKATRLYLETMVIERDYENWDDGWDEDWDDEWDDDWGSDDDWGWGMADISLEAPTEELLGIPFYPGMAFNVQLSEAMSMEDYHYYVFFSPDPQDQVVDFYKRHLGKEPLFSEGDYLFALKGKLPMPDDGLAVQINQFFT
ncbi:MAG TPA: hypothetical protein DDW87_04705, partial [Firmicutes bacterium]|nr:hypothetical protein [Bacillota bacterium]